MHSHDHDHGPANATRAFAWVTLINLAYTALEAGYGFATHSLALLSDALHNFGDVLGLGLAWGAAVLARRTPTDRHTYGWRRATLLSPLANSLILVGFSGALGWEAIRRFGAPPQIPGVPVMAVAGVGILVNLGAAWLLRDGHEQDLNRRGAFLHLVADAAVSLAAVLAGIGMLALGWNWLDPVTALLVGAVVAAGAFALLRDSFDAAMDAVPQGLDQDEVQAFLAAQPGVQAVHHLHIWPLGSNEVAMTAHLVRVEADDHDAFLVRVARELDERFGIDHPTLQIERGDACGQPGEGHSHGHWGDDDGHGAAMRGCASP